MSVLQPKEVLHSETCQSPYTSAYIVGSEDHVEEQDERSQGFFSSFKRCC